MSAVDKTDKTEILLFSPAARLVSYSGKALYSRGMLFEDIFSCENGEFKRLIETDDQQVTLPLRDEQRKVCLTTHIMADPHGNKLGLIVSACYQEKDDEEKSSLNRVDEKIIRMDRLAQVGELAASIAHEIRNPLAGINANIQVLADMLKDDEHSNKFFPVILEEIQRVEKIIKDLLDYARSAKPKLLPVNLNDVFEHVKTLVSAQLNKKKIKLLIPDVEIKNIFLADFGQLIQVFLNCIMNARDAMPQGGEISFHTEERDHHIIISIKDNGIGMAEEVKEKIFKPFFTTRAKGLGLGLSVIRKIMDDHHGDIRIESSAGEGTQIILIFPNGENKREDSGE